MDVPGSTDAPLTVGKFAKIVAEATRDIQQGATIVFEVSDGRHALRLYDMQSANARGEEFAIMLNPRTARCKASPRLPTPDALARTTCCG